MKNIVKSLILAAVIVVLSTLLLTTASATDPEYYVPSGVEYWETSWSYGSGHHGVFDDQNPYASKEGDGFPVLIDGWAIIDGDGGISDAEVELENFNILLPATDHLMVHTWSATTGCRLGWVSAEKLEYIIPPAPSPEPAPAIDYHKSAANPDPNKDAANNSSQACNPDPESVAEFLHSEISSTTSKCVVLADFSGSMSDYNEEVLESLEDFPTTADRFIFAEEMKEYKKGDSFYDIGGASFIASAMNELTSRYEEAHIFLLSDLLDNDDANLLKRAAFYGEITILLYPADDYYGRQTEFYLALKEAYPYATINVRDVDGGSTF